MTGIAESSEVSLTMAIVSLPVGGRMTRIACGSTTRRLGLPRVDGQDAGSGDLGHVGRLGQSEADDAGEQRARELVDVEAEEGEVARQPHERGELLAEGHTEV